MVRSTVALAALGAALILSSAVPCAALTQAADPAAAPAPVAETIRIQVVGEVTHPGNLELRAGDRLSLAIARAGTAVDADLSRVFLTRLKPATGTMPSSETKLYYMINLYQAVQYGDLRYDPTLRNGDRIFVPSIPGRKFYLTAPIAPTG